MKLRACPSLLHITVKFSSASVEREAVAQPTDLLLYHLSAEQEHTLLQRPRAITIHYIRQSGNVPHKQSTCSLCKCVCVFIKPYSDGISFTYVRVVMWFYYRTLVILMAQNLHNFTRHRRSNFACALPSHPHCLEHPTVCHFLSVLLFSCPNRALQCLHSIPSTAPLFLWQNPLYMQKKNPKPDCVALILKSLLMTK